MVERRDGEPTSNGPIGDPRVLRLGTAELIISRDDIHRTLQSRHTVKTDGPEGALIRHMRLN